jgi:hypothetical protein
MADDSGALGCLLVLGGLALAALVGWGILKEKQPKGDLLLGRSCPFGTELAGAHPPQGTEEWCQERTDNGSYRRHGISRSWFGAGTIRERGSYVHGERDGTWTYWNEQGAVLRAVDYQGGKIVNQRSGAPGQNDAGGGLGTPPTRADPLPQSAPPLSPSSTSSPQIAPSNVQPRAAETRKGPPTQMCEGAFLGLSVVPCSELPPEHRRAVRIGRIPAPANNY